MKDALKRDVGRRILPEATANPATISSTSFVATRES
jgi:hypothetical protein